MKTLLITALSAAILTATIGANELTGSNSPVKQPDTQMIEQSGMNKGMFRVNCYDKEGFSNAYVTWGVGKSDILSIAGKGIFPVIDNGIYYDSGLVIAPLNRISNLIYNTVDGEYSIMHKGKVIASDCNETTLSEVFYKPVKIKGATTQHEKMLLIESGFDQDNINIECFNHGGKVNAYVQWGKNKANEVAFDNGVVLPTHDNGYDVVEGKVHVFLNEVYTLIYDNDGTYSIERDNDGHGVDIVRSGCVKIN